MKTKIIIKGILLMPALILIFSSCLNTLDDQEFEATPDVYVIKKMINDHLMYGMAYYLYGNKVMETAKVTPPDGSGDLLLTYSTSSIFTMSREPGTSDFIPSYPVLGEYIFEAVSSSGEELIASDVLEQGALTVPQITKTEAAQGGVSLLVQWSAVAGAKGYVVKLADNTGKIIFLGYGVDAATHEFSITANSGLWNGTSYTGETYTVQVHAFSYDSDATDEDYVYNLAEVAVGEKEIVWGE